MPLNSRFRVDRLILTAIAAFGLHAADAPGLAYRDPEFPILFQLPAGWSISAVEPFGDRETTVVLQDPQAQDYEAIYYQAFRSALQLPPEEMDARLATEPSGKATMRLRQGFVNYQIQPSNCRRHSVSGHAALSCIAEYTNSEGKKMVEYLAWVGTNSALVQAFGRAPATDLDALRTRLDAVVNTLQMP